MELPFKKRHRVPASCSVCRKRKSKCDRVKPVCGSCRKKSIAHRCFYENDTDDSPSSNVNVSPYYDTTTPPERRSNDGRRQSGQSVHSVLSANSNIDHMNHTNGHGHGHPPGPSGPPMNIGLGVPLNTLPPISLHLGQQSDSFTYQHQHQQQHHPHASMSPPKLPDGSPNPSPLFGPVFTQYPQPLPPPPQSQLQSQQQMAPPAPPAPYVPQRQYSLPAPHTVPLATESTVLAPAPALVPAIKDDVVSIAIGPSLVLHIAPEDTITVFSNANLTLVVEEADWQHHGMFSYLGLTKGDPFIKFFRNYAVSLFQSGEISQYLQPEPEVPKKKRKSSSQASPGSTTTSVTGRSASDMEEVKSLVSHHTDADEEGNVDEDMLVIKRMKGFKPKVDSDELSESTMSILPGLASLYHHKNSKEEFYSIVERAVVFSLPCKSTQLLLFTRFFKYVHPFVPVVDELMIVTELSSITTEEFPSAGNNKYSSINIDDDNDLNNVGIFLLILKLGYLSLTHNDTDINQYTDHEKLVLEEMKSIKQDTWISLINICCADTRLTTCSSISTVQNLALLHFYRSVAPDDCHGITACDSQILFGAIIKHSFSIGLHRDPTKYTAQDAIYRRKPLINVWRSLWLYICNTDAIASMYSGTCLNLRLLDVCDVELPEYGGSKVLQEFSKQVEKVCEGYRNLCNRFSKIRSGPKVVDILTETSRLEKLFSDIFGKDFFKENICKPVPENQNFSLNTPEHETSFFKVMKFNLFIDLRLNLSTMYYAVALHYETTSDKSSASSMNAGVELFKIYIRSVVQLVYIMSYVLDNSVELFGRNYDYILTAHTERAMIKAHSLLTSVFVRILHHKRHLTEQLQKAEEVDQNLEPKLEATDLLYRIIMVEAELFVGNFRRLGNRYTNSYRIFLISYFVLRQCMENPDKFFDTSVMQQFFHDGTNMFQYITVPELNGMTKLCEDFRAAKIELRKRRDRKQFSQPANDPTHIDMWFQPFQRYLTSSVPLDTTICNAEIDSLVGGEDPSNFLMGNDDLARLLSIYGSVDPNTWA